MMIRIALYVAIGAFLLAANVWFLRSVYDALWGTPELTVRIEVIGPEKEVASLEQGLAHMVRTRLLKIKEDIQGMHESRRSQASQLSHEPDLQLVANPIPEGLMLVDIPLYKWEEVQIPDESTFKVAIGGVEVEGLFRWLQRQFKASQIVTFAVNASDEKSAFIAGNLHTLPGAGKDSVWTEAPRAANEIADTIAHAVAQKQLASSKMPVHELEIEEFQTLLSMTVRIEDLNARLIREQVPITVELNALLPEAKKLREKVPHWPELTYLVASIADSAEDRDTALTLYKHLKSAHESDTWQLEPEILERIAARISDLELSMLPMPPAQAPEPSTLTYGQAQLTSDRQVPAVLQIDWIVGIPRPDLTIETSDGHQTIESILSEVGIDLTVKWRNELPLAVMGPDERFSQAELMSTMEANIESAPSDTWHFYLIYGGRHVMPGIRTVMFDSDRRRGAAVFAGPAEEHPNETVFYILHEMGHMLNLPHPWQAYGDTKSIMSFPYRWKDNGWSWDDPSVYRFDDFGQKHIRRGPEIYVKPGMSPFLDYGVPLSWPELKR